MSKQCNNSPLHHRFLLFPLNPSHPELPKIKDQRKNIYNSVLCWWELRHGISSPTVQVPTLSPFGPGGPEMPLSPGMPWRPGGPRSPRAPVGPGLPCGEEDTLRYFVINTVIPLLH